MSDTVGTKKQKMKHEKGECSAENIKRGKNMPEKICKPHFSGKHLKKEFPRSKSYKKQRA